MSESLQERIERALRGVTNARTGQDVVASEMVRDVATTTDGKVRFTVLLGARDDAGLVREVRHAVERVSGVTDVRVDVKDPAEVKGSVPRGAPTSPQTRTLPVMGTIGSFGR